MENWETFEKNACNLLKDNIKINELSFKNIGSNDSNAIDIEVYKKDICIFGIEAKNSPAQSGQIVILIDEEHNTFKFSDKSAFKKNIYTDAIIEHINNNIDKYIHVKQSAIQIDIKSELAFNWIKSHYIEKKSPMIISSSLIDGLNTQNTILIPINEIEKYFDIEVKLRRKKSGSANLPKKDQDTFLKQLKQYGLKYNEANYMGKYFVVDIDSKDSKINLGEIYFMSKRSDGKYNVTKKSSVNNPNIMFNLKLKKDARSFQIEKFIKYFQEN